MYDAAAVAELEAKLDQAAAASSQSGPRTPTLRLALNRTEYQNAIRDILTLEIDAAAALAGG